MDVDVRVFQLDLLINPLTRPASIQYKSMERLTPPSRWRGFEIMTVSLCQVKSKSIEAQEAKLNRTLQQQLRP